MTITIVYDNVESEDTRLRSDWGFGCVIDVGNRRILFDTGEEGDILLSNMKQLGIDPPSIDSVVISHIHSDHAGGLKSFLSRRKGINVYIPASFPESFLEMIIKSGSTPVRISGPREIADGVFTTGEMGEAIKEQAMAVRTDRGLVVITGCAHPGIVEVVRKAAEIGGAAPYAVLGGFHTGVASDARIRKIIASFKDLSVKKVAPCHCSGRTARRLFEKEFGAGYTDSKVGTEISLP
jgi:7,8-dihydropterin-6-yl-methyl-4-(beta-D-ribofuranosyl)aminobenzene 5'-phosphate synthase